MASNKKSSSDHSIESIPFFPAIAWGIFVLFAGFVYLLSTELRETTLVLEAATFESAGAMADGMPQAPLLGE